jgi:glycine/D-amino acid oxidase-like deaminating enzyme/Rieske Fe-S protein
MVKRDGSQTSLWQSTAEDFNSWGTDLANVIYDVVIVGGGITGLVTGLRLQEAGKKCLILEAWNIGFGTTGGTTAHLNTLLDVPYSTIIKNFGEEGAKLVALAAREGVDLLHENVKRYTIDCELEESDALLYAQNDQQIKVLGEIYDACKTVGLDVNYQSVLPADIPFESAMSVKRQAKFHPLKYIQALAHEFENLGGHLFEHTRVETVEEDDILRIKTNATEFRSHSLVYATHIPPGVNILHLRCMPYRSYAMAVKIEGEYPQELLYDMYDPYHYIRSQKINGETYLIVGGEDHKTAHEENTEKCFLHLENYIRKHFQVTEISNKWSSQYYEPVDGLPYIGHFPGHAKNVFVATGFGGNGMTYSHVAAITLSRLLLGEPTEYEKLFSPARMKPVAGFASFVEHNADVVNQFVGKWFASEKLEEVVGLAPGEGKVVQYHGETIALNKDHEGHLHAVSPVCTHMKCAVAWNLSEQSWDCPCHGARYNQDGDVLNGPASKSLEQVELREEATDAVGVTK